MTAPYKPIGLKYESRYCGINVAYIGINVAYIGLNILNLTRLNFP